MLIALHCSSKAQKKRITETFKTGYNQSDFTSKYSASYHKNIKMTPKDINKAKETQVWINLYQKSISHKRRKKSKFNVEDFISLSI